MTNDKILRIAGLIDTIQKIKADPFKNSHLYAEAVAEAAEPFLTELINIYKDKGQKCVKCGDEIRLNHPSMAQLSDLCTKVRHFVNCVNQKEESGCILFRDDTHFSHLELKLVESEKFIEACRKSPS